jgi:hypothetical protein
MHIGTVDDGVYNKTSVSLQLHDEVVAFRSETLNKRERALRTSLLGLSSSSISQRVLSPEC